MASRSVSTIYCCTDYTLGISNDYSVFHLGNAMYDKENPSLALNTIPSLINIKSISAGGFHFATLDFDGNIFTFGSNEYGTLGIGVDKHTLPSTCEPQRVDLPPCEQISCGDNFTICLCEDGLVYSFGINNDGQLGLGNTEESYSSPQMIEALQDVEFIECGSYHTFCKTKNGKVFCWGYNGQGQLGLENTVKHSSPILCSSLVNEAIVDIKCGSYHTLSLTENQNVLSCGHNAYDQLGREIPKYTANIGYSLRQAPCSPSFQKIPKLSEIIRIECGNIHSICINAKNNFFVFGGNYCGQLGLGDNKNRSKPTKHKKLSNIIDISKGGNHTFVKTSNNEIYAFGSNEYSQLGIETEDANDEEWTENEAQLTPIRVFVGKEDIWLSRSNKSNAKSARSII